jgi:putative Holliday junction resolvase
MMWVMPEAVVAQTQGSFLAFDFGLKYLGVAVGDNVTGSSRALDTVVTTSRAERLRAAGRIIKDWQPLGLVVGLPLTAAGEEQLTTRQCRNFAKELEQMSGLPVFLVDETGTSLAAQRQLKAQGLKLSGVQQQEHAEAARLILQRYLEQR